MNIFGGHSVSFYTMILHTTHQSVLYLPFNYVRCAVFTVVRLLLHYCELCLMCCSCNTAVYCAGLGCAGRAVRSKLLLLCCIVPFCAELRRAICCAALHCVTMLLCVASRVSQAWRSCQILLTIPVRTILHRCVHYTRTQKLECFTRERSQ